MLPIPWLDADPHAPFPAVDTALRNPNGLLAAGGDLSVPRLVTAYANGIFPWFSPDEPILWWSPDPRGVMLPGDLHVSRSLQRSLRRFEVSVDRAFDRVVEGCAERRERERVAARDEALRQHPSALEDELRLGTAGQGAHLQHPSRHRERHPRPDPPPHGGHEVPALDRSRGRRVDGARQFRRAFEMVQDAEDVRDVHPAEPLAPTARAGPVGGAGAYASAGDGPPAVELRAAEPDAGGRTR